jgi:uncharacterized protein YbaP (TraB family)
MTKPITETTPSTTRMMTEECDGREASIQRRFEAFHQANPHVLTTLEDMARKWFDQGNAQVGIGMLWEAMRWLAGTQTNVNQLDLYRLNNNYRSRYVRLMIQRNPQWVDRFHTRELRAA